ncbi:MAG: HTTM domain-containing protein [Verrucomicrobiota bacterium]
MAFTFWTEGWQGWLLVIAAIAMLWKPGCLNRFTLLVLTSLVNLWDKLPFVPNHILFEGVLHVIMVLAMVAVFVRGVDQAKLSNFVRVSKGVGLFFLAALIAKLGFLAFRQWVPMDNLVGGVTTMLLNVAFALYLRALPFGEGGQAFLRRSAPVLRLSIILIYVWAAVQKMNQDYLNPEFSCAAVLHKEIAAYFSPLIPTDNWALYAAIYGSLLLEISIPFLLFFRRTFLIGIVTAVCFHLWLAIHPAAGIYSFSALILGAVYLFQPTRAKDALRGIMHKQLCWLGQGCEEKGQKRLVWGLTVLFFGFLGTQIGLYLIIDRSYDTFEIANRVGFSAFMLWGCWLGANYVLAAWKARANTGARSFPWRWSIAVLGLGLVLFNGAMPWLGGKTQTSFSMYSNLRSEGRGNHLFFNRMDLMPFQKDMVTVISSKPDILNPTLQPKGIQQFANRGNAILPYFELRRLISNLEGDFDVSYERNGEVQRIIRSQHLVTGDADLIHPHSLLARKLLWFRRLNSLDDHMKCTH